MNLIINSASAFKGGAEQVALSFIHECRNFPENNYHVIIGMNLASQINQEEFPGNFKFYIKKRPASSLLNYFRMIRWYKKLERDIKPDCVISTGGHGYWRPGTPLVGGFNIPHYIYPESPFFRQLSLRRRLYWKVMRVVHMYFYNRLDAVFVQTDDVKERLEKLLTSNAPVYVIPNTINAYFLARGLTSGKLPEREPGEIRLLTLSSYYPHKNLEIINQVAGNLFEKGEFNFRFIVTIPHEKYKEIFTEDRNGMIKNVGPVPIKECPSLYEECNFMFLPTLLECFSAAYAEAMVMKRPILTSDMSFAHSVCKDAAVYFDPLDPEDITEKIIALSGNQEKQDLLIKNGESIIKSINSPYDRARRFLEICQNTTR